MSDTVVVPELGPVECDRGVAGQVAYSVVVTYPGESPILATFVGSTYGAPGPVVAVMPSGRQTFVTSPERFGPTFGPEWVRRFFGDVRS